MSCYLDSKIKKECFGCEACKQICPKSAIEMIEDDEGFRYPSINQEKCINCGLCKKVCSYHNMPERYKDNKYAFGGYHKNWSIRDKSTSGGFFSAIVDNWCDENYVIFGAASKGLKVYHTFIGDKSKIDIFRKSKYSQSNIGKAFVEAKKFLEDRKKVLFSGTPCQIAGLRSYLKNTDSQNLLTIEVICEGVPSPLYIKKYEDYLSNKYNSKIEVLDYRYTDKKRFFNKTIGKWDFEVMHTELENRKKAK